jgi:hypothetical protein
LKFKSRTFSVNRQLCSLFSESIEKHLSIFPSADFYEITINELFEFSVEDFCKGIHQIADISFGFNLQIDSSNAKLLFIIAQTLKIQKIIQLCRFLISREDMDSISKFLSKTALIQSKFVNFQFERSNKFQISPSSIELDLSFDPKLLPIKKIFKIII